MGPRQIHAFCLFALMVGLTFLSFDRVVAAELPACAEIDPSDSQFTCKALARRWRGQPSAVLRYGEQMIARASVQSAQAVYLAFLAEHPDDVAVMKALIRVRAQARFQRDQSGRRVSRLETVEKFPSGTKREQLSTPAPSQNKQPDVTHAQRECWHGRWQAALQDCTDIIERYGATARLLERSGDLHRSLGNGRAALTMYQRSLAIDPAAVQTRRKYLALKRMLNDNTASANPVSRQSGLGLVDSARTNADVKPPATFRAADRGRRLALVIGNDRYSGFEPLQTARNDARLLASILASRYGFKVTTLLDARRSQIMTALSRLRRDSAEQDDVLIYYAGHGYLDERTGRGYWLPVDAQPNDVTNWLSNSDVTDLMAGMLARRAIVIADSCFAGSLIRATPLGTASPGVNHRQNLALQGSRTVMTSGGLEPVLDNGSGQHSIFARALAHTLSSNTSGISASALHHTVRAAVTAQAAQTPQYSSMNIPLHRGGDFVFVVRQQSSTERPLPSEVARN